MDLNTTKSGTQLSAHSGTYLCHLDYIKLLMAVFVVALHTHPLFSLDSESVIFLFFKEMADLAVPFFFLTSGYFLCLSCQGLAKEQQSGVLRVYLKKIVIQYCLWSVIYLPISLYGYYSNGASLIGGILSLARNLVFKGENFLSWQLWYLLSTVWAVLAIYLLGKIIKRKIWYVVLAVTVFLIAQLLTAIAGEETHSLPVVSLIAKLVSLTIGDGRVLLGFFYITMGMMFALKERYLPLYVSVPVWAVLFMSAVLTKSELIGGVMHLAFFEAVLALPSIGSKRSARIARKMSTCVYYVHMLVVFAVYCLSGFVLNYGVGMFVITTVVSLGLAAGFVMLEQHKPKAFRFLFG